jgi:hypothetical protein
MVHPFIPAWEPKHWLLGDRTEREKELLTFSQDLSVALNDMRRILVADMTRLKSDNDLQERLITLLANQISRPRVLGVHCPYCSGKDAYILEELESKGLLCQEYMWRQDRITSLSESPHAHGYHQTELIIELDRLNYLFSYILHKSQAVLQSSSISEPLATLTHIRGAGLVFPDVLASYWFRAKEYHFKDYFDRTTAQKWMDAVPHGPCRERYVEHLEEYIDTRPDDLNHRDCFGRNLLHIACIKNWYPGVKLLLESGADPSACTTAGSLPLHYAAANGSLALCHLLLERKSDFDAEQRDNAGLSAADYALSFGHFAIWTVL